MNQMNTMNAIKVIAVLSDIPAERIINTAEQITATGVKCICINLDRHDSIKSLVTLKERFGDSILLGVGGVTSPVEVETAAENGAQFISSYITDEDVITCTREMGLISIAGAFTPTEIASAHRFGADYVKLFPSDIVSLSYFSQIASAMPQIKLVGASVMATSCHEYFESGAVLVETAPNLGYRYTDAKEIEAACEIFKILTA